MTTENENCRADALTDDLRQALGESISEYFGKLDSDEGIRAPEGRILRAFDYCDSRNVDDLIDRAIEPALAASPVEQPTPLTAQVALAAIETFEIVGENNDSREPGAADRFILTEFIAHAFGGYPVDQGAASATETGAEGAAITDHDAKGLEIIAGWLDKDGLVEPAAMLRRLAAARSPAMAAAPADDKRDAVPKWIFDQMVNTLAPAWDYVQTHQEQFDALAGDDKTKIVVEEFLKQARAAASPDAEAVAAPAPIDWDQDAAIEALSDFPKGSIWYEFLEEVGFDPTSGPIYVLTVQGRAMLDQLKSAYFAAPQPAQADAPAEAREPVCKLCCSTGPDLPCAYPTEINRQQARRIAELEARFRTPADAGEAVTAAARDVLAERRQQVETEGWTSEHDDAHASGELAMAGACYATTAVLGNVSAPMGWPWSDAWFKPTTPRRNLIKAAALIIAEIERIDRAAARTGERDAS
ncbi:hypothetical protein [Burkholderia ubonensis]|uniref:hypothetical protein n=1 Tax=Burkholderia ubonensis TaxID=101571 RepID=UPI0007C768ED|nr:hypothetical protein [Burkholderia ubonensis]